MDEQLSAVELMGTVDKRRRLKLDQPLPFSGPRRVRVIVLYSGTETELEPSTGSGKPIPLGERWAMDENPFVEITPAKSKSKKTPTKKPAKKPSGK